MPALPCETLQGKILGTAPGLDVDPSGTDIIGNDKRVNAIVFAKSSERFPVVGNRFRIQAKNLNTIWFELVSGGEIIRHMDAVETGGLHGDQKISELGICLQNSKDHRLHSFHTVGRIGNRAHVDEPV